MNLVGKTYQEIEAAVHGLKRDQLIAIIQELAGGEPFFSPEQISRLRGISRANVMRRIRARLLRAHMPVHNRWRVPLSALREWDEQTRVI